MRLSCSLVASIKFGDDNNSTNRRHPNFEQYIRCFAITVGARRWGAVHSCSAQAFCQLHNALFLISNNKTLGKSILNWNTLKLFRIINMLFQEIVNSKLLFVLSFLDTAGRNLQCKATLYCKATLCCIRLRFAIKFHTYVQS